MQALRLLPLCLLAVVLWREHPWTVQLSAGAPWAVAAAIVLNFAVSLPLKAARWRVALLDRPPFRQVLAATIEGLLANAAIGFGSGDLVRAARLRADRSRLGADYACTWAERGAELLALAVLVFVTALVTKLGTLVLAVSASRRRDTSRCWAPAAGSCRASAGGRASSTCCRRRCRHPRRAGWRPWLRCRC
jgi:hypothetical protein